MWAIDILDPENGRHFVLLYPSREAAQADLDKGVIDAKAREFGHIVLGVREEGD